MGIPADYKLLTSHETTIGKLKLFTYYGNFMNILGVVDVQRSQVVQKYFSAIKKIYFVQPNVTRSRVCYLTEGLLCLDKQSHGNDAMSSQFPLYSPIQARVLGGPNISVGTHPWETYIYLESKCRLFLSGLLHPFIFYMYQKLAYCYFNYA